MANKLEVSYLRLLRKLEADRENRGHTNASGTPTDPEPEARPAWDCPICHDLGYIKYEVPLDDPRFGKAFPCTCQAQKRHDQRVDRIKAMSSLANFADKTFENFSPSRPGFDEEQNRELAAIYERAWSYAEQPQGWLLLTGSYGTGKTHLAAAIANHRVATYDSEALLITVPDLLDHLRATYAPNADVAFDQVFDQVRNTPLLILDDLGAESSTPWALEKLYALFNHRHARRLPTVITTNQDMDLIDGRIRSRLLDHSLTSIISMNLPDHRSPAAAGNEANLYDMQRYYAMTFERFEDRRGELTPEEQAAMDKLILTARGYAENPMGWLVFAGAPGTGKTHLAAAIAHERRAQGDAVIMTTTTELIDYLRAAFGNSATVKFTKRFQELRTVPLLVLDNLVIGADTAGWVRERLHEILIYRFDQALPTVITMYTGAEVTDPRIMSRIENRQRSSAPAFKIPPYQGAMRRNGRRTAQK
jgi:DNA replication protein DnaC